MRINALNSARNDGVRGDAVMVHQINIDDGTWASFFSSRTGLGTDQLSSAKINPINNHVWFGASNGNITEVYYDAQFQWSAYSDPNGAFQVNGIAFDL